MRRILFYFLILMFFENALYPNGNLTDKDELVQNSLSGQVIKILLDGVKSNELENVKFSVIIPLIDDRIVRYRPAYTIIWFKYSYDDQHITVDYLSFPRYENFNDWVSRDNSSIQKAFQFWNTFLEEIISNKKIINTKAAKQLKIPIPSDFRNDNLFNKMRKIDPYKLSEEEWHKMGIAKKDRLNIRYLTFDRLEMYYWGFKSDETEFIRFDDSYHGSLLSQILRALRPITIAVLEHETPEHWKEDFKKYEEERNRKHSETIER